MSLHKCTTNRIHMKHLNPTKWSSSDIYFFCALQVKNPATIHSVKIFCLMHLISMQMHRINLNGTDSIFSVLFGSTCGF